MEKKFLIWIVVIGIVICLLLIIIGLIEDFLYNIFLQILYLTELSLIVAIQ
jgi:hypothetical protein